MQLNVEGQITEATAKELLQACAVQLASGRGFALDLSGVTFADNAGVTLLRELESRGSELVGCSGFLEQLLRNGSVDGHVNGSADGRMGGNERAGETDLVERLRAGDAEAFETIVRRFGGRMLATARRFFGTEDDAQDAVQEAFLSAFKAIHHFAGESTLSTWLHRIVVNAALMQLRSRRRRPEEPINDLLPRFDEEGRWADEPTRWNESGEVLLQRRDTRAIVRRCIDRLPENYRTVLLARDIEELDTEEAADALGITSNAVKVRLHRARQALKTLIEREFQIETGRSSQMLGLTDERDDRGFAI